MVVNNVFKRVGTIFGLMIMACIVSSFYIPSSLKFCPMLMKKGDVATLMANSKFSHIILVNTNIGVDDNLRLTYQLACYAYNTSNQLISGFSPLILSRSVNDSLYTNDMYLSTYRVPKASLTTAMGTTTYSYLRFTPYMDRTDPSLSRFVSYSISPVAADGVTGVYSGKAIPVVKINPSPPR